MYSRYYTNNKLNAQFAADYPECEGASASKFIGDDMDDNGAMCNTLMNLRQYGNPPRSCANIGYRC